MPFTDVRGPDIAMPERGLTGDVTPEAVAAQEAAEAAAVAAAASAASIDFEMNALNLVYATLDSRTYGTDGGTYVTTLQTLLGNAGYHVINRGIGGRTAGQALAGFGIEIGQFADARAVVIYGFVNGINLDQSAATIKADIAAYVDAIQGIGALAILCTDTPFKGFTVSWSAPRQAIMDEVNDWIRANTPGADIVVELYNVVEDPANPDYILPAYDDDGIHFSSAGYAVIAQTIFDTVNGAGGWNAFTGERRIAVSEEDLRLTQHMGIDDKVQFREVNIGWKPARNTRALTIATRDPLQDEEQIYLQQQNDTDSGYFVHVDTAGSMIFKRLASGISLATRVLISGLTSATSFLFGRWQITDDTRPLRISTESFTPGEGSAVDVGFEVDAGNINPVITAYAGGGNVFATQIISAAEHKFRCNGTLKLTLTPAGHIVVGTMPQYASNAAAIAGGLAVGTIYSTGGDPDRLAVVR